MIIDINNLQPVILFELLKPEKIAEWKKQFGTGRLFGSLNDRNRACFERKYLLAGIDCFPHSSCLEFETTDRAGFKHCQLISSFQLPNPNRCV